MAVADQSYKQSMDQVLLTDDHAADLLVEGPHPSRGLGHRFVDGLDAGVATRVFGSRSGRLQRVPGKVKVETGAWRAVTAAR